MTDIEQIIAPFKGRVPGCALMVTQNGSRILTETQGYSDLENEIAVTANTNFRLASVTKHFTAVAILELRKKQLVSLDSTLGDFFPHCAEYGKKITIAQLLTHTSGLPGYEQRMEKKFVGQIRDCEVLELLMQQNHGYFEPGSTFRYSNGGYCILAMIIEQISGQTLATFLQSEFFIPLGMKHTFANEEGATSIPHRAYGYSRKGEGWIRTDQDITSATIGDGGVYSSLIDLAIWDRFLDSQNLFEKQVVTGEKPEPIYYGFGLFRKEYKETEIQYHAGSSIGFRTGFYRVPEKKLMILFLSNRNEGNGIEICEKVFTNELLSSRFVK